MAVVVAEGVAPQGPERAARSLGAALGVGKTSVERARAVHTHAPDLVPLVTAGTRSLNDAADEAANRRRAAESDDERMAALRAVAPDLADLVQEDRLTLTGAWAEHGERERRRTEQRRDARALLTRVLDLVAPEQLSPDFVDSWAAHLGDVEPELLARVDDAITVLTHLAKKVSP
jgi:hypothetical protein